MTVYFYHTQNIQYILGLWREGRFPAHFLYGATALCAHGIDVVWHRSSARRLSRWRRAVLYSWRVIRLERRCDALYATHYQGIEPVVLLRALRLYRHPVVVWMHQSPRSGGGRWRRAARRLFFRGFDRMIFFSERMRTDTLQVLGEGGERMVIGHWGADLTFYDRVRRENSVVLPGTFISTGKELRDMPTLVAAFNALSAERQPPRLSVWVSDNVGAIDYVALFRSLALKANISVRFMNRLDPGALAIEVARAECVVVCCQPSPYTVGLTTIVEALALGKPVICSRNACVPIDIAGEGCGLTVPYGDVEGWTAAVRHISDHPAEAAAMGRRGRRLAETTYNDARVAMEVAAWLRAMWQRGV